MRPLALLLAVGAIAAVIATTASAQVAPAVGATVKDPTGKVLGVVEKVIVADGRPRQIQVRDGGALRTLPVAGLTADGAAFVTVLSKAEFDALPGVE